MYEILYVFTQQNYITFARIVYSFVVAVFVSRNV